MTTALAVSSDAFFYKLGEDFYLHARARSCRTRSSCSASAPTPASTCRSSSTAGCRRTSSRRSSSRTACWRGRDAEPAARRPPAAGDRPGPAGGDAAAARRRLLGVRQRRLRVTPHVVQAILAPETPDGDPGLRRPHAGHGRRADRPAEPARSRCRRRSATRSSGRASAATSPGPGANGRSTTAEELFADYPADAIQVAGKTGTAQGADSYPWNDSSVFAAFSVDPTQPVHVVSVPREGRLRLARRGAGRQVHVPRAVGHDPARPGAVSEPLDTHDGRRRPEPLPDVDVELHGSTNAGTIRPRTDGAWACRCSSASPTPASATSARARRPEPQHRLGAAARPGRADGRRAASSSSRRRARARADPYTFVTRQVDLRHRRRRRDGRRDGRRLRVAQGSAPRALYVLTVVVLFVLRRRTAGRRAATGSGVRRRADPVPAGRVRQVHGAAGAVRLPQRRAQRRGQLPPVPRRR